MLEAMAAWLDTIQCPHYVPTNLDNPQSSLQTVFILSVSEQDAAVMGL